MTRSEHLSFCSVCTNRKFTTEVGFICSLTDKKADFDISCPHFTLDSPAKQERNKKYIDEIETGIQKRKTNANKLFGYVTYIDFLLDKSKPIPVSVDSKKETIVLESNKKNGLQFQIIALPLIIGFLIYNGRNRQGIDWIPFILFVVWIYVIYRSRLKKEILRIGPLGILINKKEYVPWHAIDFIHKKTEPDEGSDRVYLILRLTNSTEREILLNSAAIDFDQLAAISYCYMRDCKKN